MAFLKMPEMPVFKGFSEIFPFKINGKKNA
jgi:hypothetical protein